jgi:hypothetical protein
VIKVSIIQNGNGKPKVFRQDKATKKSAAADFYHFIHQCAKE